MINDSNNYSIPKKDLTYYKEKYGANIFFVDKYEYMNTYGDVDSYLIKYNKLFENQRYCIIHF